MKRREVVTAFLRNQGEILLVRRSDKVGSYQGYWSAISGYLEDPTPLEQAQREIREETGVPDLEVHLVRTGDPVEAIDTKMDVCWVVHPFLFEIDNREAVRLDWENTELRWVKPEEISNFSTVPKLKQALQNCFGEDDG